MITKGTVCSLSLACIACLSALVACQPFMPISDQGKIARVVDLRPLWDSTKPYVYSSEYYFMQVGAGPGSRFLETHFDSAIFTQNSSMLCVSGRVAEYGSTTYMKGVQVIVGTILRHQGQILRNDNSPPIPMYHYQIVPLSEDTTDSQGRFSLCAKIDSSSSLLIASNSYYLELYKVGKLVDSAWTQ